MKLPVLGLATFFTAAALLCGQEPADPPARVARLSFLQGPVSLLPANSEEWVAAAVNYPLTTGDRLWTAGNSYAELHIGATAIHIAPHAAFAISRLDDTAADLSLAQGAVYIRIPTMRKEETCEVDTPNGPIALLEPGSYRIDVDVEHDATTVTVRGGAADVLTATRTFRVLPGRMVQIVGRQEVADTAEALPPDEWEQWCAARDRGFEEALAASDEYVSPEMDGAEDLALNGEWIVDAEFGAVWCPSGANSGWAPYRNGHWVFIAPWGWTWIDAAPWAFAPLHFGRWIFTQGRWMWTPGKQNTRPVYAPALVAFVGGPTVRNTLAARKQPFSAWIPLAPGEAYRPPYRASEGYVRRINASAAAELAPQTAGFRNRDRIVAAPVVGANPVGNAPAPPPATVWRPVIGRHEPAAAKRPAAVPSPEPPQTATEPRRAPAPPAIDWRQQQRAERERAEQQQAEERRIQQQRAEQQQAEQRRREEQQRAEQQRVEQQRVEQVRAEQHRAEQRRFEQQQAEQRRAEQQRAEQQQAEQRRAEQQRAEQQQAEQRRAEQQRAEQQQAEQRRAESKRAEEQRRIEDVKKADDSKKKQ